MFKAIYILFKGIFELKLLDLSLFAVKLLYGKIVWLIFKYLMPYEKKIWSIKNTSIIQLIW